MARFMNSTNLGRRKEAGCTQEAMIAETQTVTQSVVEVQWYLEWLAGL